LRGDHYKNARKETRAEMEQWLLEEHGRDALNVVRRFIDDPEPHYYELAKEIQKEIRGSKNQHDLTKRIRE